MSYPYTRYLAAKKSVDDRALNRQVVDQLRRHLPNGPLQVLEIGAGLGTMVARLWEWGLIGQGHYHLLDVDAQLLADSREWLKSWAVQQGIPCQEWAGGVLLDQLRVHLVEAEIGDYLKSESGQPAHLLIANAFLDLVDVPATLPGLFQLLLPGGLYWFAINFDGETIFQPDHPDDQELMQLYHQGMDQRVRYGRPAGESRAGRHLYHHLCAAGAPPLASGSSDWVVHAQPDGQYPGDEAHFVACILDTIEEGLQGCADPARLGSWLSQRRAQLQRGELLYIAHQLDFCGKAPK
jgi:hypothetical protein